MSMTFPINSRFDIPKQIDTRHRNAMGVLVGVLNLAVVAAIVGGGFPL